jgi:hypothetical protein
MVFLLFESILDVLGKCFAFRGVKYIFKYFLLDVEWLSIGDRWVTDLVLLDNGDLKFKVKSVNVRKCLTHLGIIFDYGYYEDSGC